MTGRKREIQDVVDTPLLHVFWGRLLPASQHLTGFHHALMSQIQPSGTTSFISSFDV